MALGIETTTELVDQILRLILFLQAVGIIIIIYLVMSTINYFRKKKDTKNITKMREDIEQIKKDIIKIKNKI